MARGKHTGGKPQLEAGAIARPIVFKLGPTQQELLDRTAREQGTTVSRLVREALAEYFDRRLTGQPQGEAA